MKIVLALLVVAGLSGCKGQKTDDVLFVTSEPTVWYKGQEFRTSTITIIDGRSVEIILGASVDSIDGKSGGGGR